MSNVSTVASGIAGSGALSGMSPGVQPILEWQDQTGATYQLAFDCVVAEDWPDEGTTVTEHPVEEGADIADHVRAKLPTYTLTIRQSNEPFTNAGPAGDVPSFGPVPLTFPIVQLVPSTTTLSFQEWKNNILARALAADAGGVVGGVVGGQVGSVVGAVVGGVAASLLFPPEAVTSAIGVQSQTLATGQASASPQVYTYPGADYVQSVHALLVELKEAATQFTIYGTKQTEPNMVIESLSFHRDKSTGTGQDCTIGFKQVRVVTSQTVALPQPHISAGGGLPTTPMGQQALTPDDLSYQEAVTLYSSLGWVTSVPGNASSLPVLK